MSVIPFFEQSVFSTQPKLSKRKTSNLIAAKEVVLARVRCTSGDKLDYVYASIGELNNQLRCGEKGSLAAQALTNDEIALMVHAHGWDTCMIPLLEISIRRRSEVTHRLLFSAIKETSEMLNELQTLVDYKVVDHPQICIPAFLDECVDIVHFIAAVQWSLGLPPQSIATAAEVQSGVKRELHEDQLVFLKRVAQGTLSINYALTPSPTTRPIVPISLEEQLKALDLFHSIEALNIPSLNLPIISALNDPRVATLHYLVTELIESVSGIIYWSSKLARFPDSNSMMLALTQESASFWITILKMFALLEADFITYFVEGFAWNVLRVEMMLAPFQKLHHVA